jgi:hypothetical protein
VAGKELRGKEVGEWIRPVSKEETGELSIKDRRLQNDQEPMLLDIITIPLLEHTPHSYQTENYLIAKHQRWKKQGIFPCSDLPSLCDPVDSLWINGHHSSGGLNDRMPLAMVKESLSSSLLLIKPSALSIIVENDLYVKLKVQVELTFNEEKYRLMVTDPAVEHKYLEAPSGKYTVERDDVCLCLSIGEPYKDYCYKLVAGMINFSYELYTIGHSTHSTEEFIRLLTMHSITALCDVRSDPYSQFNPQFNREPLQKELNKHDIAYIFMGKELGPRSHDPDHYVDDRVQYDRLAKTDLFHQGLERLRHGMKMSYRIALMCAEKDPICCHRTILVCRHLRNTGVEINHILENGSLENNRDSERRLMQVLKVPQQHLFKSKEELIEHAYDLQGNKIAYALKRDGK